MNSLFYTGSDKQLDASKHKAISGCVAQPWIEKLGEEGEPTAKTCTA